MDMDTGDVIRMPLIDNLLAFPPSGLTRYFQNAQTLLNEEVQADNYSKLESFIDPNLKGCEMAQVLTTLFLAVGNPGYVRPNEKSVRANNMAYKDFALDMLKTFGKSFNPDAKTALQSTVEAVVKAGVDLDEIARKMDSLFIRPPAYYYLWIHSEVPIQYYERASLMARMLEVDSKSVIVNPLCVWGITLAVCGRLYHKGYRRMAAFTAREHHSDIATCMMVSGATEIEVRDMPFIEHLDRDLGYNRIICDLVDLEKYAWPYVMDSVYASKRESVCVFALSVRCMKDAEYYEWRDDVARSYTVDQIVKWEKCYLVKIVRKRNSGSKRTIFRDLARCKLSTAIEGVKDRSTKGSRLIRDGDWLI